MIRCTTQSHDFDSNPEEVIIRTLQSTHPRVQRGSRPRTSGKMCKNLALAENWTKVQKVSSYARQYLQFSFFPLPTMAREHSGLEQNPGLENISGLENNPGLENNSGLAKNPGPTFSNFAPRKASRQLIN